MAVKLTSNILKEQLNSIIEIKNELVKMNNLEKASLFRDYEKQTEKRIDLLENKDIKNKKNSPLEKEKQLNFNFTTEATKLINSIDKPVFTNKIVVSITEKLNIISDELLKLDIDLSSLRKELTSISINDFVTNDNTSISLNSLKAFKTSFLQAKHLGEKEVSITTLFLSILRNETDLTTKILNKYGVNYKSFSLKLAKKPTNNTV
ncbi:hypothetical protein [Olleya namhaensis]|uniref:hypothetical protein n=1 Tax=Olleya namhaensis TaxID=1144750 RepID=UPI002493A827|nr:hypothetical protein [Olleya namhaensis]